VIDEAVETFRTTGGATSLRSLHEMSETAYKTFEITDGLLRPVGSPTRTVDDANAPRQHFPSTFEANGYVDVLSTDLIRSTGLLYGDRVVPYMTETVLEIDTLSDVGYLEYLVKQDPDLVERLFS
jgi:N-acylneuraminate cytidylyltransferase